MYGSWIIAGLIAGAAAVFVSGRGDRAVPASATVLLSALLGFASAKVGYVLLLLNSTLVYDGLAAFANVRPGTFSFFAGAAGGYAGIVLGARLFGLNRREWLRRCVPFIPLFIAFLRAGEKALGTIGVGGFVPADSSFARFPFAVTNSYGEHLYAVFYLEAFFALVLAAVLLLCRNGRLYELRAEMCAFFLALPQIFAESLRARCMKWGFVRVEQLLCALLVLVMLFVSCRLIRKAVFCRFWPFAAGVLLVVCIGLLEYALDKTDIPVPACYLMMAAALLGLGFLETYAVSRRFEHTKKG